MGIELGEDPVADRVRDGPEHLRVVQRSGRGPAS